MTQAKNEGLFANRPITPKLELIYHLPYALIIPVCVCGALIGHIALTRTLLGTQWNAGS